MARKVKLLIVDDNQDLCESLLDILELKGYEVMTVFNGYQAIAAVKKEQFNLVLMDVKMPGINGIDTLKILKKISPGLKVIMITAFADDVFYRAGLQNGDFEVVRKPLNIERFLALLKKTGYPAR
ncbi:response regulator [bacterium]|nr:response regulator [bacterium]